MTIDAIIFDMDGVLVDSEPVHFEATRLLMREHGIDYTWLEEENFFGCTDREVFRQLRRRFGLSAHEDELADAWIERVVQLLPERIVPMPGVPAVLSALRASGRRLALASSSSPAIIRTTIEGLGLLDAFEASVSGRDVAKGKPAPDIFLEAARRLGLAPARCLVVEDSQNGLRAALAAGIPCITIPCASTARQDFTGAAARLSSLADLPAWLDARRSFADTVMSPKGEPG
jgi:HAD superfamily hydrolase (TIGR01509 family)